MKQIISKNVSKKWLKRRKKDKSKLVNYWKNLYPMPYARMMVAQSNTVEKS